MRPIILKTKPFLNEDGTVKKLDNNAIQKIQSFELVDIGNRLPNVLFLTVSNEQIYCHILDRTKLDLLVTISLFSNMLSL